LVTATVFAVDKPESILSGCCVLNWHRIRTKTSPQLHGSSRPNCIGLKWEQHEGCRLEILINFIQFHGLSPGNIFQMESHELVL
jgi:hypothetical protein